MMTINEDKSKPIMELAVTILAFWNLMADVHGFVLGAIFKQGRNMGFPAPYLSIYWPGMAGLLQAFPRAVAPARAAYVELQ